MVGSRGLGRRECRLDAGSKIDLKNLRDSSCSLRSDRLGIFAQCRAFVYGMSFVKYNDHYNNQVKKITMTSAVTTAITTTADGSTSKFNVMRHVNH